MIRTQSQRPPASRRPIADKPGTVLRVLCVSGDAAVRELFIRVLRNERVIVAPDFAEAVARTSVETPELAFIDLDVGDGAGLSTIYHFKSLHPDLAIYALTTKANLEAAANAIAVGCSGLLMLPLSGDDILTATSSVRQRLVERYERDQLRIAAAREARMAGWLGRVTALSGTTDKHAGAKLFAQLLEEVSGARSVAVYLAGDAPGELVLGAATSGMVDPPARGNETQLFEAFLTHGRVVALPIVSRNLSAGCAMLREPLPQPDTLLAQLATTAAAPLALLAERERSARGGAALKDPTSSAYSFAYYVDVAGREIARARRYGRPFSIVTAVVESPDAASMPSQTQVADRLLSTADDTDMLARVDENEFHMLLPETSGMGAHACRRRILRIGLVDRPAVTKATLLVGGASFPHDGQDLAKLLRVARERAEMSRASVVHKLDADSSTMPELLEMLTWETANAAPAKHLAAVRPLELVEPEAQALVQTIIADARRGGPIIVVVTSHPNSCVGAAARAAIGHDESNVTFHGLDLRATRGCGRIEALAVIAEHGAYAFVARNDDGLLHGAHAADPLLADVVAERMGRAAGVRVFG
jgi:ActR/RegA family two-component response regulator